MSKVINRYIFKEIGVPFLLSLSILTVTALLSKVIKIIELMVTHGVGGSFIFWFVLSAIPSFLIYTIPISFLIGVLVAMTRLSSDSEITAMKALGLSLFTLMRPVLYIAAATFAVSVFVTLFVFPWGNINLKNLMFEAVRTKMFSGFEEKTFYDRFKGVVLYIDHLNQKTGEMEGIFISETGAGTDSNIFFASRGVFSPSPDEFSVFLRLYDGTIHRRAESTYHIARFSTYTLELGLSGGEPGKQQNKHNRELYPSEFLKVIDGVKAKGEDPGPYIIDFHKRFALPASVFVFALLGVPLGIQKIRAARFTGFSIALGVVLVYYVLSTALEAAGENGAINPVLAVWGSDIIFAIAGSYVFYRAAKDRPLELKDAFGFLSVFQRGGKDR